MNRWVRIVVVTLISIAYWLACLSFAGFLALVFGDCWVGQSGHPEAIRACTEQKQILVGGVLLVGLVVYAGSLFLIWKRRA